MLTIRHSTSRMLSVAVGLLVLVCGSACTPQAGTTGRQESALGADALDLLTNSGDHPARSRVLELAEEKLVERCMAARGQVYWPVTPPPVTGSDEERTVDLPRRRAKGFGLTDESRPPRAGPNDRQPVFQLALFGNARRYEQLELPNGSVLSYPTSGCVAESRAALYGDARRWARVDSIPQVLNNTLREQIGDAPELARARSGWLSCMTASGYPYPDPDAAVDDLSRAYRQNGGSASLRRREIAVATADGECALRVHVPSTELALRRDRAESLPATRRRELNDLGAAHCAAYRRAQPMVGEIAHAQPCRSS
ncbi:hypothetical protein [Micromonospora sp. NBC_01412]|uniref:hypothetical protein n=1 Tax=Micromonospora sp. NBC_01412 TaxID=2903590 RepID=UPI00324332CE